MNGDLLSLTTPSEAASYRADGHWSDTTLYHRFVQSAERYPDKTAIACDGVTVTYSQLRTSIENLAGHLVRLGIAPQDVVAMQSPNAIEQPLVHLALNRMGAIYMPIHDGFRTTEVRHLMAKSGAVAAIMWNNYRGFDYPALYEEIAADLPHLRHRISIGGTGHGTKPFEPLLGPSCIGSKVLDRLQSGPEDVSEIILSSGTTSLPKLSVFTNNNMVSMNDTFTRATKLTSEDVAAALAPMGTGSTGYLFAVLPPLLRGGTSVLLRHWTDPNQAVDLIVEHKCTYATAIPTQLNLMLPFIERRHDEEFANLRFFSNAGAPLAYDVGRRIENKMGCRMHVIYGATDGGILCASSIEDSEEKRIGTVGRVLPGRKIRFIDETGNEIWNGRAGEIYWKTPDKSLGYFNDMPASLAGYDRDGYFKSGDLIELDDDGYLRIVGRVKEMILRGGQHVSPRLIEDLLIEHPAIVEVAVVAMPHPTLFEQACAFVVLENGASLDLAEAVDFLRDKKIAKWQLPERLEIVDALPKSAGAKIAKYKLSQIISEKLLGERSRVA